MEQNPLTTELIGSFFDLFVALFNTILYNASRYPKESFLFVDVLETPVPICQDVKVAEYIEMTTKKIVSLLSTNLLEGFQLNLMERSIILQRFVFVVEGAFTFDSSITKISVQNVVAELERQCRTAVEKLNSIEEDEYLADTNFEKQCSRFQIVLGLTETASKTYDFNSHGVFNRDPDSDIFPWSKPRVPMSPARELGTSILDTLKANTNTTMRECAGDAEDGREVTSGRHAIDTTPTKSNFSRLYSSRTSRMDSSSIPPTASGSSRSRSRQSASPDGSKSPIASRPKVEVWPISTIQIGISFQLNFFLSYVNTNSSILPINSPRLKHKRRGIQN